MTSLAEITQGATVANKEPEAEAEAPQEVTIIAADNPSPEELKLMLEDIEVNYDFSVNVKPTEFKFRTAKDDSGIESKREPVLIPAPVPSVQGLMDILETGGKGLSLLLEAAEGVVYSAIREIIASDIKINAHNFPYEKVSWQAIADQPKPTRRGAGIPKEVWTAFGADYVEVMQAATGKSIDKVTMAANLFLGKCQAVKTRLGVLEVLQEQLAIYIATSENIDDFVEVVEFLQSKIDAFLNVSDEEMLQGL